MADELSSEPWYSGFLGYAAAAFIAAPLGVLFTEVHLAPWWVLLVWVGCWLVGAVLLLLRQYFREKRITLSGFIQTVRTVFSATRVLIVGALFIIIVTQLQIQSLQTDMAMYVLPRRITSEQSALLVSFLKAHDKFPVFLKFDAQDQEAAPYANQIYAAFNKADWPVTLKTDAQNQPQAGLGLSIWESGENSKPQADQKHDRADILQQALRAAGVFTTGGGGQGAGDYAVFLLVGRRPLIVGYQPPLANRFARWIVDHFGAGGPF